MKKVLKVSFALLIMMTMMLFAASLAVSAEDYVLYVGGVQVTETNKTDILGDGTVSYDSETATLYLSGANIVGYSEHSAEMNGQEELFVSAIYAEQSLTISLEGSNYVQTGVVSGYDKYENSDNTIMLVGNKDVVHVLKFVGRNYSQDKIEVVAAPSAVNSQAVFAWLADIEIETAGFRAIADSAGQFSYGIRGVASLSNIDNPDGGIVRVNNADVHASGDFVSSDSGDASSVGLVSYGLYVDNSSKVYACSHAVNGYDALMSCGMMIGRFLEVTDHSSLSAYGSEAISYGTDGESDSVISSGLYTLASQIIVDGESTFSVGGGKAESADEADDVNTIGLAAMVADIVVDGTSELSCNSGPGADDTASGFAAKSVTINSGKIVATASSNAATSVAANITEEMENVFPEDNSGNALVYDSEQQCYVNADGSLATSFVVSVNMPAYTSYTLFVGGVQVTEENADDIFGDGTAWYDAETRTLTLNNANITGRNYSTKGIYEAVNGIYFGQSLNIVVKGDCTVAPVSDGVKYSARGIASAVTNTLLTITGDGDNVEDTLRVTAPAAVNDSCAICMEGADLTVKNVTVYAYGGESDNISYGMHSTGITNLENGSMVYRHGGNLTIEDANLYIYGGDILGFDNSGASSGLLGRIITIKGDSYVNGRGGDLQSINGGSSSGLTAVLRLILNDNAVVDCYGGTIELGDDFEPPVEETDDDGNVILTPDSDQAISAGITTLLGVVQVTDNARINAYGGTVSSVDENDNAVSIGVMATLSVSLEDNAVIDAYGGESDYASAGLLASSAQILGGTVTGSADENSDCDIKAGIVVIAQMENSTIYDTDTKEILTHGGDEVGYINSNNAYPAKATIVPGVSGTYPIFVGGVQISDWNKDDVFGDGTVSYNPETNTLTLNNANITGAYEIEGLGTAAIYTEVPLNIVVSGTNSVSTDTQGSYADAGIFYAGSDTGGTPAITITGSGTDDVLNVKSSDASNMTAIIGSTYGDVVFKDVTVNAEGGNAGNSTYGIVGGMNQLADIIVDGAIVNVDTGDVVADENTVTGSAIGVIAGGVEITNNGELNIIGGDVTAPEGGVSAGAQIMGDVTVTDGSTLNSEGGDVTYTSTTENSDNVPTSVGISSTGNITVDEGSTVKGTGGTVTNNSNESSGGSGGVVSSSTITVDGVSNVIGQGGDAPGSSVGVFGTNINITNGTVEGTSSENSESYTGIGSDNDLSGTNPKIYDSETGDELTFVENGSTTGIPSGFYDSEGNSSSSSKAVAYVSLNIWVCGVQVTTENMNDILGDGTVSYDYQTNTLVLDNANLTTSFVCTGSESNVTTAVIYTTNPLNILVKGECVIDSDSVGSYNDYGIIAEADNNETWQDEFLLITGADENASLVVTTNDSQFDSCPIAGEGINVKISNLNLECTSGSAIEPFGILGRSSSVYIEDSVVNATASSATSFSIAIGAYNGIYISDGSEITATASDCFGDENSIIWSYALYGGNEIEISGGSTVVATSGIVSSYNNAASVAVISNNITISGDSVVVATSGEVECKSDKQSELVSNAVRGYESLTFADGTGTIYATVNCTNENATIANVCLKVPAVNATVRDAVTGEVLTYDYEKETYVDSNGNISTQVSVNGGVIYFGDYNLAVGGIEVTSQNAHDILGDLDGEGATAYYDAETNTLTLENADIKTYYAIDDSYVGIICMNELNINLVGDNKVSVENYETTPYMVAGIGVMGTLNISGAEGATLEVKSGFATGESHGILAMPQGEEYTANLVVSGNITVNAYSAGVNHNGYGQSAGVSAYGTVTVEKGASLNGYGGVALISESSTSSYKQGVSAGIVAYAGLICNTTGTVYGYAEKGDFFYGGIGSLGTTTIKDGVVIGEAGTDVPSGAFAAGLATAADVENVRKLTGTGEDDLYDGTWQYVDSNFGGVYMYSAGAGTYTKLISYGIGDLKVVEDEEGDEVVSVTVTGTQNVLVAVASYEASGRMVDIKWQTVVNETGVEEVMKDLDLTNAVIVKAFMFDGLMTARPLCEPEILELETV